MTSGELHIKNLPFSYFLWFIEALTTVKLFTTQCYTKAKLCLLCRDLFTYGLCPQLGQASEGLSSSHFILDIDWGPEQNLCLQPEVPSLFICPLLYTQKWCNGGNWVYSYWCNSPTIGGGGRNEDRDGGRVIFLSWVKTQREGRHLQTEERRQCIPHIPVPWLQTSQVFRAVRNGCLSVSHSVSYTVTATQAEVLSNSPECEVRESTSKEKYKQQKGTKTDTQKPVYLLLYSTHIYWAKLNAWTTMTMVTAAVHVPVQNKGNGRACGTC